MLKKRSIVMVISLALIFMTTAVSLTCTVVVRHTKAIAAGSVPTQYISKLYTEALGRLPDQGAWQDRVAYFQSNGCNVSTLQNQGAAIYLSSEYSNLNYDNAARVLTLYRGILNREPDQGGFTAQLNTLNSGTPWSNVVNSIFSNPEFSALAATICGNNPAYHFGTYPAIPLPATGGDFQGGTGAELQALLNRQSPGGIVRLAQKALVVVSSPLTLPAGVTLTTVGNPGTNQYALMGRIVRAPYIHQSFTDVTVRVLGGAKLLNIWVDGQRGDSGKATPNAQNIRVFGGTGTTVANSRSSNTAGSSSLETLSTADNYPCASNTITGNVITAYSSDHSITNTWTDGLSIHCENSDVENNQVVDATDVGIIIFNAAPAVQRSNVRNNVILSAGNSAFGALGADQFFTVDGNTTSGPGSNPSFAGAHVENNLLWTGPNTHFNIGLLVGTRAWFGAKSYTGSGGSFNANSTGSLSANFNTTIAISGIRNVEVKGNSFNANLGHYSYCPQVNVGASISNGYASESYPGSIQPYTDVPIEACVSDIAAN